LLQFRPFYNQGRDETTVLKRAFIFLLCVFLLCLCLSGGVAGLARAQEPAIGRYVFGMNVPSQEHVLLVDVALPQPRTLRLGSGPHTLWDFSPQGCRLLATLGDRLISADPDGANIADWLPPGSGTPYEPSWSPDGTRIVATLRSAADPMSSAISIISADASIATLAGSGLNSTPRWSPDGQWVAFIKARQRVPGADLFATAAPTATPGPGQQPPATALLVEGVLWVARADGTEAYPLTNFPTGSVSMPRWSPDGSLLSFVYAPAPNQDTLWIIAPQQGSIPAQLSYDYITVLDTTWQPDGSRLIVSAMGLQRVAENVLWSVPLVGRADTDATRYLPLNTLPYADYPRFSPDGRYLAVRSAYGVALVDVASAAQITLAERWALGNTPVIWQPQDAGCG
jgi:WD40 repeat protein